ncbi:MAG: cell wall metabolism sensor histidine kinase WalK [Clostridia bacterium]|nr:cell wall metabolism sensor histidine kinase WalK [Clostridia bacterium]
MLRNVQLKIILIFGIIGIIIISAIGAFYGLSLNKLATVEGYSEVIYEQIKNLKYITIIAEALYGIITVLIGMFMSKTVLNPITKLIKDAPRIAAGENIDIAFNEENKKKKSVDELTNAFDIMTKELRENLNEVNRKRKQIETILLHMTDGIIAFDMEGNITHINPAATELFDLSEEHNSFDKIFKKVNININLEKTVYLEDWTSLEQRATVGEKHLKILFASFKDEKDIPSGIMVVIQDITEHVKLDNMRKEFVADVSHELKTPITSIMGYADTLLESEYDKDMQEKFLNVISSEARRMAKLVTDLLTLSRYDTNRVKKEITEFDLGDLVKNCQEKLQLEINKKSHKVECFVTANVPPVKADYDGIERVVLNILSNSIKYTPENGTIKIYVGFVYNDAYIKVIDNGIGIPEEDLNRIFERFYRVDKARTREMGGTGLGLSIAKEILDQNNSSIDIKSKKGEGTEVVIRIPTK